MLNTSGKSYTVLLYEIAGGYFYIELFVWTEISTQRIAISSAELKILWQKKITN